MKRVLSPLPLLVAALVLASAGCRRRPPAPCPPVAAEKGLLARIAGTYSGMVQAGYPPFGDARMVISESGRFALSLRQRGMVVREEFDPFSSGTLEERRGRFLMHETWRDGTSAAYPEILLDQEDRMLVVPLPLKDTHYRLSKGVAKLWRVYGADRRIEYTVILTVGSCEKDRALIRRVQELLSDRSNISALVDCDRIRGILVQTDQVERAREILKTDPEIGPLLEAQAAGPGGG